MTISPRALEIADRVEAFVRETVVPYEQDPRRDHHGAPTDEMVWEMREKARAAGERERERETARSRQKRPAAACFTTSRGSFIFRVSL